MQSNKFPFNKSAFDHCWNILPLVTVHKSQDFCQMLCNHLSTGVHYVACDNSGTQITIKQWLMMGWISEYVKPRILLFYCKCQNFSCCKWINHLTAEWALRALTDFTLSNARRFYSSMGNPLDGKGLSLERHHTKDVSNCFLIQALHFWDNVGHNNIFQTDRNKLPEG